MKSRGHSILELRKNELRNKRESKLAKLKNLETTRDDHNEIELSKQHSSRLNPKIEQFKLKNAEIIEKINKKLKETQNQSNHSKIDNLLKILEKETSDFKLEKKKKREKNRVKDDNKSKNESDSTPSKATKNDNKSKNEGENNLGKNTNTMKRKINFSKSNERDSFKRNSSDESES